MLLSPEPCAPLFHMISVRNFTRSRASWLCPPRDGCHPTRSQKALRKGPTSDVCVFAYDPENESSSVTVPSELVKRKAVTDPFPTVDWTRYHLNVLFVDKTDTVRARFAAAIFERIAEWNGYGRILLTSTCGIEAKQSQCPDLSKTAALMTHAASLKLVPKYFARPAERFEPGDLDRHDLIIAVDSEVKGQLMKFVPEVYQDWYDNKICLLTQFSQYAAEDAVKTGGFALMPMQLSFLIRPSIAELQAVEDITSPELSNVESGYEEWLSMVRAVSLSCGGLMKYLIDQYPDDLPEYDPL